MLYQDLAKYGLRFITPDDTSYPSLVSDIKSRFLAHTLAPPFESLMERDIDHSAVLMNESGRAVIVLAYIWTFASSEGQTRKETHSNLGSSKQWDVLSGRGELSRDVLSFILPGSKRLITPDAMFGDNSDVLPRESPPGGGAWVGRGGGIGFSGSRGQEQQTTEELQLDAAILEDGLCVGPDESGLLDKVFSELQLQRRVSEQIVEGLRGGASIGQVFEMLRPLAKMSRPGRAAAGPSLFVHSSIQRLIYGPDEELMKYFEAFLAQPSNLRRAT